jgi:hypothetical protein
VPARPEEAVEHVGQLVGIEPGARVADGECAVGEPQVDRRAGRAPRRGVVEEVVARTRQSWRRSHHGRLLEIDVEATLGMVALRALHRLDHEVGGRRR